MDLSIIILNYNTKALTAQNIASIEAAQLALDYEIIVVDNASRDGSVSELRRRFPKLTLLESGRNGGFAFGNNIGLRQATGRYLLVANPDTTTPRRALETLVEYMDEHPDVGIIGPKMINTDGSLQWSCLHFPKLLTPIIRRTMLAKTSFGKRHIDWYLMKDHSHMDIEPVDWVTGAYVLIRRKTMEKIGLLDERYFMYVEDADWCRRCWSNGYKVVYNSKVEILHHHRRASASISGWRSLFHYPTRIHLRSFLSYLWKFKAKRFEPTQVL